jgi:hypothetical protein
MYIQPMKVCVSYFCECLLGNKSVDLSTDEAYKNTYNKGLRTQNRKDKLSVAVARVTT